ncbi:MAG: ubiquinol-cytochrome C chaperone family protein [Pseudomonadota bacterium]
MGLLDVFSFEKRERRKTAERLRDSVLAAARQLELYQKGWAEDTLDGRFEQVAVHSALLMRRLRGEGEAGRALSEEFMDQIFSNLDYGLRETGVGDASISRKVRGFGERLYGLARGLNSAFEKDDDTDLADFAERNALACRDVEGFTQYLRHIEAKLAAQMGEDILRGDIAWPQPGGTHD